MGPSRASNPNRKTAPAIKAMRVTAGMIASAYDGSLIRRGVRGSSAITLPPFSGSSAEKVRRTINSQNCQITPHFVNTGALFKGRDRRENCSPILTLVADMPKQSWQRCRFLLEQVAGVNATKVLLRKLNQVPANVFM